MHVVHTNDKVEVSRLGASFNADDPSLSIGS
jgi:hypothetical protein